MHFLACLIGRLAQLHKLRNTTDTIRGDPSQEGRRGTRRRERRATRWSYRNMAQLQNSAFATREYLSRPLPFWSASLPFPSPAGPDERFQRKQQSPRKHARAEKNHSTSARADCTRPDMSFKIGVARAKAFLSVCPGKVFISTFTAATVSPFQSCSGMMTSTESLSFP